MTGKRPPKPDLEEIERRIREHRERVAQEMRGEEPLLLTDPERRRESPEYYWQM